MKIFARCGDRGMTQGGLHQVDGCSSIKGMGSMSMAQPVRENLPLYFGPGSGGLDDTMHLGRGQMAPAFARVKGQTINSGVGS